MDEENFSVTITYTNEEDYKNILMDYIIKFILKNNEGSLIEEKNGEEE